MHLTLTIQDIYCPRCGKHVTTTDFWYIQKEKSKPETELNKNFEKGINCNYCKRDFKITINVTANIEKPAAAPEPHLVYCMHCGHQRIGEECCPKCGCSKAEPVII